MSPRTTDRSLAGWAGALHGAGQTMRRTSPTRPPGSSARSRSVVCDLAIARSQGGFSYLEVLVSMALVAAALPAMVGAVGTSVRGTGLASRQAIALELARGRLEELTGLPYGALLAGGLSDAVEVGGRPYERLVTVAALDPETDAESGEDAWTTGWAAVRVEVDGVVLEARVTGP